MIGRIFACILCLFPLASIAQPVSVIAGEHADFSRLVVMFDESHDWEFGRVEGGYELRTDANTAQLVGSQIFDFIPRSRIGDVTFPGPGRMFISVTCNCFGDVFEIRQGRLAVDIKDSAADRVSRFEDELDSLEFGALWRRDAQSLATVLGENSQTTNAGIARHLRNTPDLPTAPVADGQIQLFDISELASVSQTYGAPDPEDYNSAYQQFTDNQVPKLADIFPEIILGTNLKTEPRGGNAKDDQPSSRADTSDPVDDPKNTGTVGGQHSTEIKGDRTDYNTQQIAASTGDLLTSWPRDWDGILGEQLGSNEQRVALAQTALLEQLSRAAAQGLLQAELPETSHSIEQNIAESNSPMVGSDMHHATSDLADIAEDPPTNHIRIETAADRNDGSLEANSLINDLGRTCMADDIIQVADWGSDASRDYLSDFRAKSLREFDKPEPKILTDLAKRYIYLGFGAEAINLIEAYATHIENAATLLQLADIVDGGSTMRPGRLASQITCPSPAALWAVLSVARIPAEIVVDTNYVLRTFAGLPKHLRLHLGPILADRFLEIGEIDIAASIGDYLDRASVEQNAVLALMKAKISRIDGEISQAMKSLQLAVNSNSPIAPQALAELLELKLTAGETIKNSSLVLADAFATEHRGTEIGRRLRVATIRSYVGNGQVDLSFDLISASLASNQITLDQVAELTTEVHLINVSVSSDADFLRTIYQRPLVANDNAQDQHEVRRLIASRLIQLGLPEKAKQQFEGFCRKVFSGLNRAAFRKFMQPSWQTV